MAHGGQALHLKRKYAWKSAWSIILVYLLQRVSLLWQGEWGCPQPLHGVQPLHGAGDQAE